MQNKTRLFIQAKIDAENMKAEVFASYAQVMFLVLIMAVYLLSPKGFTGTFFEPVKVAFWFYLPVICIRWYLASRSRLKQWQIYVFLVLDVAILAALIWSYHIQYQAPFTLSLRSPTFLYFFVFLSLRALSFRVAHVFVYTGGFLLAWGVMIGLARGDGSLRVTRLFKDYLEPNTFILGVEIDKMLAVCLMGIIVAFSIYRKRLLLSRLAEQFVKEEAMQSLLGKGALTTFNLLENELVPGQVRTKVGATLIVDLRGFSRLSYVISSEQLLKLLGEYQQIVAQRVFDCGGVVDKYLGDGVLAHFGIANELPNFASSAVRAAELIESDLHSWVQRCKGDGLEIGFGVAVAHGPVAFGVIGHPERMEITVLGESVNFAAKLEKHTKVLGHTVLMDATTYQAARDEGHESSHNAVSFEQVSISGIPTPQNLVALTRDRAAASE